MAVVFIIVGIIAVIVTITVAAAAVLSPSLLWLLPLPLPLLSPLLPMLPFPQSLLPSPPPLSLLFLLWCVGAAVPYRGCILIPLQSVGWS
jgi:hypothetical protein